MLKQVIIAAIFGVAAWLICVFAGGLLALTGVPLATFVGAFLVQWAVLISILVFLWYFFAGGSFTWPPFVRRS